MKNRLLVNFGSLSVGMHEYSFELTTENWKARESARIKDGNVLVLLKVDKSERHLTFDYTIKGEVQVDCDNCLSRLQYPISDHVTLHIKLSDEEIEDEVDLIHLPSHTTQWDMTDHACDSVELSLPMKTVCSDSINREECDEEYMERMNARSDDEDTHHPEWDKLKDLFKQN